MKKIKEKILGSCEKKKKKEKKRADVESRVFFILSEMMEIFKSEISLLQQVLKSFSKLWSDATKPVRNSQTVSRWEKG